MNNIANKHTHFGHKVTTFSQNTQQLSLKSVKKQIFVTLSLQILFFFRTFAAKLMHMKRIVLGLCVLVSTLLSAEQTRYIGGDISMLPKYEQYNSYYKDAYGKKITDPLAWFISDCGWNTFRVRIFVHPTGSDPSVCQDLEYVTALGKRIKDAGAYFMLDFHYSDTWVDATHIQAPEAWKGSSDEVMADSVETYTRMVLTHLNEAGAKPDLVQVGNEIMYGLCGIKVAPYFRSGDNWTGYLGLLKAGCKAVREICPEAKIIIHTDRPANQGYNNYYYKKLCDNGVDFDIIGLSYYPFWHGYLTKAQVVSKTDKNNLVEAIEKLAKQFPAKEVQIVECAYNFQWWPTSGVNYDTRDVWSCSVAGQYNFVKDLVDALKPLENVTGINYWFPEEAGNGDKGTVIPSWLNRGFWDENKSTTGHAINRTAAASSTKPAADVCAPYYMRNFLNEDPQGWKLPKTQNTPPCRKLLRYGRLLLQQPDGSLYAPDGCRL